MSCKNTFQLYFKELQAYRMVSCAICACKSSASRRSIVIFEFSIDGTSNMRYHFEVRPLKFLFLCLELTMYP